MKVLALDTSTSQGTVAVSVEGKLAAGLESDITTGHSEKLLPLIDSVLKKSGLSIQDIELFIVTSGPGSFTGLRIGIASVKGLAFTRNLPIVGLSTLEAMACSVKNKKKVASIYDALRGALFFGLFDCSGRFPRRIQEDMLIDAKEFLRCLEPSTHLIGNGIEVVAEYSEETDYSADRSVSVPQAKDFIFSGIDCFEKGIQVFDCFSLTPCYLQAAPGEKKSGRIL